MVDFDIQRFLAEAHAENRMALITLAAEVREGFKALALRADIIKEDLVTHERADLKMQGGIETRLRLIEEVLKSAKWFMRAGVAAMISLIVDLLWFHFKSGGH